jgi:hypothetical protein
MTFLHPALLWLLPLAAIPILLHLLTLHRLKTVELSTYRFLFDSYVQQRRKMQFLEALLAMLRALFLAGLVLVFCRLVIKPLDAWSGLFGSSGGGREVIMLVDCSASMNAKTAGVSAFDRAKARANYVAERLNANDRLTLIRVAAKPEEVFSRFTTDSEAIRNRIDDLKMTPGRANIFAALMQVFGPGAPQRANPTVYLFTDCQASGWREVRNQGLERLLPSGTRFVIVNVGSSEPVPNLAVLGNAPRRQRAVVGLPIILRPRVANYTKNGEPVEVPLGVFIDEKEIARVKLTLKPGETATKKITYVPTEPGVHRGRFEISGKAIDGFPDDDSFLFTLNVVPRIKVVLINGNPAADPFENECLYLRAALTMSAAKPTGREGKPSEAKPTDLGVSKEFVHSLELQEIPEASLNPEVLREAAVVVLANCGAFTAQQCIWVRDFVAGGGGLIVFPGDRVTPQAYNDGLFPQPGAIKQYLTEAKLAAPEGDPEKADTFERLAGIDFAHPVLSVFDDPEARYLKSLRFYRRFPLSLPEKHENTWPLAQFTNGKPALVESRFGDGVTILAAFPANTKWTNLPVKPEFVPLVLRLVSHVEHRPEVEAPSVVAAGGAVEVSVSGNWAPANGKVTNPAQRSSPLVFERSGTRLLAAFEQTGEHGYYAIEVKSGRPEQPKGANLAFAVNLAPEESDFAMLGEEKFRELLPGAEVKYMDATAETQQEQLGVGNDQELWRPLIYVLFALILIEFLFATLGGRKKEGEENRTVLERIRALSPGSWVGRMTGGAQQGS